MTTERISLGSLFQQCVNHATEIARNAHGPIAVEVNKTITRINDSYFRLQIWGSDIGARSTQQITFDDILSFENGTLSAMTEEIFKGFNDNFEIISRVLDHLSANFGSAVVVPEGRPYDLLSELRTAVAAISELVRALVELSGPIQMEQALQKHDGPYKDLQKQVEQTKVRFQDRPSAVKAQEPRTISCAPDSLEMEPTTGPVEPQEINLQPGSFDFAGKRKETRQASTAICNTHLGHTNPDYEAPDLWSMTYLLSFDGGGVRALLSLLILEELMRVIEGREIADDSEAISSYSPCIDIASSQGAPRKKQLAYLPCHYFDYIAGTNTGGLIAIMLSRLRMSVPDCIEEFTTLINKSYRLRGPFSLGSLLSVPKERYNSKALENAVKVLVRRREESTSVSWNHDGEALYGSGPHMCKTIVLSYAKKMDSEEPYIFRSYDHTLESSIDSPFVNAGLARNLGPANDIPIWQVARAITAAPMYFRPIEIDQHKFLDGGFGAKNPTMEAVMEIAQMNKQSTKTAGFVLSIGTGKQGKYLTSGKTSTIGRAMQFRRLARTWAIDSDRTHKTVDHYARGRGFGYKRLDVESGFDDIKLDEITASGKIIAVTTAYLQRPEVQAEIREIARILVENRQKRSHASRSKWELFCLGKTTTLNPPQETKKT